MVGELAQRGEDAIDADEAVLDLTNAHAECDDRDGWCNGVPLFGIYSVERGYASRCRPAGEVIEEGRAVS
jgi:hypothetical protein